MHVPVVVNDTDVPDTEHTTGVTDENVTGNPDDAAAETLTGDCTKVASGIGPKRIDCALGGGKIWKVRCTGGAALNAPLPLWSAWMVHVPVVVNETTAKETEHIVGVFDENVTGRPDDAVAEMSTSVTHFALSRKRMTPWRTWFACSDSRTAPGPPRAGGRANRDRPPGPARRPA